MKNEVKIELEAFQKTLVKLLDAAIKHDTAYDEIEAKLEQVRVLAERGIDAMDERQVGKKVSAQHQIQFLAQRQDQLSESLGDAFLALRSHLGNAQHYIGRGAKDQLDAVESDIAKVLAPFSKDAESAQQLARKTDFYIRCARRATVNYGGSSDPRAEGKEALAKINQLLAGDDFFACFRNDAKATV